MLVDLSHTIHAGMVTYPGLPAPAIFPHLTREASRSVYADGTEFAIDSITMVGNTGTYIDSPYHRDPDGADLAGFALDRVADLSAVVVRFPPTGRRGIDPDDLRGRDVAGRAVLLHTGWDVRFGTPEYGIDAPYLSGAGAQWLADAGAVLVGIDSVNIDDARAGGPRPAHTVLLRAGIAVVEHLTCLAALPDVGSRFTAVPPKVDGFGTFPVRAFARVPG